jgi:hypothetical protein
MLNIINRDSKNFEEVLGISDARSEELWKQFSVYEHGVANTLAMIEKIWDSDLSDNEKAYCMIQVGQMVRQQMERAAVLGVMELI